MKKNNQKQSEKNTKQVINLGNISSVTLGYSQPLYEGWRSTTDHEGSKTIKKTSCSK